MAILKGFIWYLAKFCAYFAKFYMLLGKYLLLKMAEYYKNKPAICSYCKRTKIPRVRRIQGKVLALSD